CDLSHYGVMEVTGEEAAKFLQGQFTNDVQSLADGQAQWNGWCSPKGRLLATFLLWRDKDDYFLLLPRSLQPAIQKRLAMFVLRSKVKMSDVSTTWQRFGIVGTNGSAAISAHFDSLPDYNLSSIAHKSCRVIRLSASRYIVIAEADVAVSLWLAAALELPEAPASHWDLLNIREGIIEVAPETQDAFVPQMANFELIGGVNFRKGCYTGQEIVARTQYRGILKRRMVRVSFAADQAPPSGTAIYSPKFPDQACGAIALAASTPDNDGRVEALVIAQIESIASRSLFLDDAYSKPLDVLDLPYVVS
ncbi:MAG: folate-binding protein, partial [Pseudomonadota bacterium]